jgi:hypothetical protein
MRRLIPVGIYVTVQWNGERIAMLGNIKPGISAGSSMGHSARVIIRKTGGRR